MSEPYRYLLLFFCASVLATGTALAAEKIEFPSGWKSPMGSKGTVLEATRRIFPDANLNRENNLVLARDKMLRMPGTSKQRAALPSGTKLTEPWKSLTVRSQGKTYAILLLDGLRPEITEGGWDYEVAVLAVFPQGEIDPTDVAEVKQDRFTSLGEVLNLGSEDAFVVSNSHSNSEQSYALTDLFHLRDGRLRRIVGSLFTLNINGGGCVSRSVENLSWRTIPDGVSPPRIIATIELIHTPTDFTDGCPAKDKPRNELFRNSYRWNTIKGHYLDERGNFGRLSKWNERNS
ncbi:conserved exported hypothetical protein [Gammaproteobacteria bacterium]